MMKRILAVVVSFICIISLAACGGSKTESMTYDYKINDVEMQVVCTYPKDAENYKILAEGDEYPKSYGDFQIRAGEAFIGVDYKPNNEGSMAGFTEKFKNDFKGYTVEEMKIGERDTFLATWAEKKRYCYLYIDVSDIREKTVLCLTFTPADTENGDINKIAETEEFKSFINGITVAKKAAE